jgi:hypothetical protein
MWITPNKPQAQLCFIPPAGSGRQMISDINQEIYLMAVRNFGTYCEVAGLHKVLVPF